jgi:hypothetical protein
MLFDNPGENQLLGISRPVEGRKILERIIHKQGVTIWTE